MGQLDGKVALVTGASRGIGEATARLFAAEGARVMLLARGSDDIARIADEIGEAAAALTCDVADYGAVSAAVAETETRLGPVDILVNNAGVVEPIAHMAKADPAEWGRVIDINLKGVMWGMHAVLPRMLARGGGSVLTISSGAAHHPIEAWSHYCASKAGAAMLTRMLHLEYGHRGIRAMGLSPGTVATEMQREIKASGINPVSQLDWSDHIPPEWPARALLWMCSEAADAHRGEELSLRDEDLRKRLDLA